MISVCICSISEVSKSPRSSPIPHHKRQRFGSSRDSRTPEIVSTVSTLPFVAAAAAAFTAFAVTTGTANPTTRTSSPSRSISPALSSVSRTHSPVHHSNKSADREAQRERESEVSSVRSCGDRQHRKSCADDGAPSRIRNTNDNSNNGGVAISEHDRARSSRRRARASISKETSSTSTVFSVVYDIACCDGPVRFHRVLNENYSSTAHGVSVPIPRPQKNCPLTEAEDLSSENDENGGPGTRGNARSPSDSSNDGSNSNNGGCYTCGYCKHTFKSQYCYRKHAKRHLLPTRINEEATSGADHGPRQDTARSRREVRLLDLNVQYYPCKICGCKFPSYYFVHKHRKLCHANEEESQDVDANVAPIALSRDADTSSIQDAP